MDIYLEKVDNTDRNTLYRLLQYSLFELSDFDLRDVDDEAVFEYKYFDKYLTSDDRDAFFIKDKNTNKLLGFVMINTYLRFCGSGHSIAEFMVLPKYRRNKIGKKAAFKVFNKYHGNWEVEPVSDSKRAYMFWENVIKEYTSDNYEFKEGIFIFTNN